MSYLDEINDRVMLELTEILLYCNTCEFQVRELLKVANCIFDQNEFFIIIDAFTKFKSNMGILEALLQQLDEPISMLQLVTLKSMVNELRANFDELIEMLAVADKRIDADQIDFGAASLLNDMLEKLRFDVVDFDGFEAALESRYFIPVLVKPNDEEYNNRYGELEVLMVESFKTKRLAYTYALKYGLGKDSVWSMYT